MAAATENSKVIEVHGSRRVVYANLDIADTNTYVTGLSSISFWSATPTTATTENIGGTVSAGTITFATGGSLTGVLLKVEGR